MSQDPPTPNFREVAVQMAEALSRGDFDAYMSHFAPHAVWQSRVGTRLQGAHAIRSYTEEFNGSVEGFRAEVLEVVDLGSGVSLVTARQGGRVSGSASNLLEHVAFVTVLRDGLVESMVTYSDTDEARAAAVRLAAEPG